MPKKYAVTPRIPPGRQTFIATFYNSSGDRVTRNLLTGALEGQLVPVKDPDIANLISVGLVALKNARVKSISEALALDVFISPDCFPLYFSETERTDNETLEMPPAVAETLRHLQLQKLTVATPAKTIEDRNSAKRAVAMLHAKVGELKRKLDTEREARAAEQRSMLAHAVKTAARAPSLDVATVEYEKHIYSKTNRSNAGQHMAALAKLRGTLPAGVDNVANITAEHIGAFLDARAAAGDPARQVGRRRAWHLMVARFFSFLQERYGLPTLMTSIPFPSKGDVERERGDIDWHTLKEVEAAIEQLPDDYWRALVGCLAYAGLQLAELCWLRVDDLKFSADRSRARLWVTTVDDDLSGERHAIKTENRRRGVDVHPVLLKMLVAHIDAGRAGKTFLFPMRAVLKKRPKAGEKLERKRRGLDVEDERWRTGTLSKILRGYGDSRDKKSGKVTRYARTALLPAGMNAKSLRRTFGSLLLRAGKTTAQVAAAMGNTERVVAQHYARILGAEVDVNF